MTDRIEPTETERRNGWDEQRLTEYVKQRERQQLEHADIEKRPRGRPREANSKYSPTRWRG